MSGRITRITMLLLKLNFNRAKFSKRILPPLNLSFPARIYNMEEKSSTQSAACFNVYLPIFPVRKSGPDDSEFQFFKSPNYSKFDVECD